MKKFLVIVLGVGVVAGVIATVAAKRAHRH
jgi:hypothetical protein